MCYFLVLDAYQALEPDEEQYVIFEKARIAGINSWDELVRAIIARRSGRTGRICLPRSKPTELEDVHCLQW